jgi:phosphoribosyl 1,2-cyclic phosphate phosphodiesterase
MGSGGSGGVPYAGNIWGKCDPNNPKNRRTRPSVYIEQGDTRIVIDTGPEFRQQVNQAGAKPPLAGVLYTHYHADHVSGIDDLRSFWFQSGKTPIDAYASPDTVKIIGDRFDYLTHSKNPNYPNMINLHNVQKDFMIGDVRVRSFDAYHYRDSRLLVTGYRIGDFGYTTDVTVLTDVAFETLKGVKVWVVGIHAKTDDYAHPSLAEVQAWNEKIGAEKVYTTHMTSSLDYDTMCASFPNHIRPAYDGLEFIF